MNVPLINKSISLNQLCKLLGMMEKDPGNQTDDIIIFLDDTKYQYTMLSGEIKQVIIDDIAYDAYSEGGRILIVYASTERDPDPAEVEFDGDNLALYKFFDVMYNALDQNKNMFIPGVIVYVGSEKFYYNGLPDGSEPFDYPLSNIKRVYVAKSPVVFTTCTFIIHVDKE